MGSIFIFDGDCAFCSSSIRLFRKLTDNRINCQPFQWLDLESLGTSAEIASKAVIYKSQRGQFMGAEAIARALIDARTGLGWVGHLMLLPGIRTIAAAGYRWVARNRHRLPGGTPECSTKRNF